MDVWTCMLLCALSGVMGAGVMHTFVKTRVEEMAAPKFIQELPEFYAVYCREGKGFSLGQVTSSRFKAVALARQFEAQDKEPRLVMCQPFKYVTNWRAHD